MKKENHVNQHVNKPHDYLFLYALLLAFFGIWFWKLFDELAEFSIISQEIMWHLVFYSTLILTAVVGTIVVTRKTLLQKIKTSAWLAANINKIVLWYAMPLIILISLTKDNQKEMDDLEEMISISWTIFSIAIAIFFVWEVLIPKYLTEINSNRKVSDASRIQMQNRFEFHEKVNVYFASADILLITLIVLLAATVSVYMSTKGVTWFNVNIVRCSFNYCVFTALLLFVDTLKPIKKERDDLIEKVQICKEEIEQQAQKEEQCETAQKCIELIDDLSDVKKDEKERLKAALRRQYDTDRQRD